MAAQAAAKPEQWVGRQEVLTDVASAGPVIGLSVTFDYPAPAANDGDEIPPGWQWLYFLPRPQASEIGPDGHAERGGFLPPIELPRRMFGGGRMTFHSPLRIGERLRRESEIASVTEKSGRSGRLVFVTVAHRIYGEGGLAIEEENDIVYREAAGQAKTIPGAPADLAGYEWQRRIEPDPVLLFRFSALTFNGHRIHYDLPYVTEVEGYPGLVVHGPLTAMLLLELARRAAPDRVIESYWFQAMRPLFVPNPLTLAGRPDADGGAAALQAVDHEGFLAMQGGVAFRAVA